MVPGEHHTEAWSGWCHTGFWLATFFFFLKPAGFSRLTYVKYSVFGVVFVLNSATGTPLEAIRGPNMAAGYTMEEVPTCKLTGSPWKLVENAWLNKESSMICIWEPTTRQRSQTSISFSTLVRMWESRVSPKNTVLGLSRPLQSLLSHLNSSRKNSTPVSNYILPK